VSTPQRPASRRHHEPASELRVDRPPPPPWPAVLAEFCCERASFFVFFFFCFFCCFPSLSPSPSAHPPPTSGLRSFWATPVSAPGLPLTAVARRSAREKDIDSHEVSGARCGLSKIAEDVIVPASVHSPPPAASSHQATYTLSERRCDPEKHGKPDPRHGYDPDTQSARPASQHEDSATCDL